MKDDTHEEPRFKIPLPGGRVARVPLSVLERYVEPGVESVHAAGPEAPPATNEGDEDEDVQAHSLSVDGSTGASVWHTDWEFGECEYVDETGFPQRLQAWHRHPFGTDYAELYDGH